MDKEDIDQQEDDQIEDKNDGKTLSKSQKKKLKEKAKKETTSTPATQTETKTETAPAPIPEETKSTEVAPTESKEDDDDDDGEDEPGKPALSKAQKKKLKEKAKKEAAAKTEPATKVEAEDPKGKKDTKKKPLNAAAALAQQRLLEKQKLEEEQRRIEEEIRKKEEEEQKKRDEEERIAKEEEAKRKKLKDDKLSKLKEAGEYKTAKQLEKEAQVARQREDLLKQLAEQGIKLEDLQSDQPRRNNYKKKPKQGQQAETKAEAQEEAPKEEKPEPIVETTASTTANTTIITTTQAEEQVVEDWESMLSQVEVKTEFKPKETEDPKPVVVEPKKEVKSEKPKAPKTIIPAEETKTEKPKKSKKGEKKEVVEEVKVEEKPRNPWQYDDETRDVKNQSVWSDEFRSPVCCILGHVDTGKTKLLDKIRNTSVQDGEAGGITQQIGATFFPYEKLREEVLRCADHYPVYIDIPGLLIIDTPGHESFSNLRSRGHGLCDIAILVIDIMHGLQKQTMESIDLLRFRKTPFIIALNKIDRMYGWKAYNNTPSYTSLKKQQGNSSAEFRDRAKQIIGDLMANGLNAALYYDNPDPYTWDPEHSEPFISVVPTSAITGEGIPDLLSCVVNLSQRIQRERILRRDDDFKCTVLEVKVIEGLGATIDVMLINGYLREGDKIVVAGYEGVIVTQIRSLLTPHPMKEMRVKNEYIHHKEIRSAMGIKIAAVDLDKALAGSDLFVIKENGDEARFKEILDLEVRKIKRSINLVDDGCFVVASTLGSLEALLQFLKTSSIPVAGISIGPVSKTEVIKAMKPLQIVEGAILKEYATILAFDVKIMSEAQELANQEGVKIFTADIIYHLFDQFTAYLSEIQEERKRNEGKLAVFPCVLRTVAFFNKKDPIIMGVDVVEGVLKIGTPICAIEKDRVKIGTIDSIEKEHKPIQEARISDGSVAIKFKGDPSVTAGRHFEVKDRLVSIISRESIDALKKYFREDMTKNDWELVRKLKKDFNII